jgi:type IV secretion system protein VirB10
MSNRNQYDAIREAVLATRKVKVGGLIDKAVENGAFVIIGVICLLFLFMMYFPYQAASIENKSNHPHEIMGDNLKQNLAALELLKEPKKNPIPGKNAQLEVKTPEREVALESKAPSSISKEAKRRMSAPMTLYVFQGEAAKNKITINQKAKQGLVREGQGSAFLNAGREITRVVASKLAHPDYTLSAGEMISATLETAINSELPGMVKAIVSKDVYSSTGKKLLIPKGSIAIGQFSAEVKKSQSRALIIWERLQRPDGVLVSLNSPNADSIGRSGLSASSINHHYFERLSSTALLSVLGLYAGGTHDMTDGIAPSYPSALMQSAYREVSRDFSQYANIKPTLHINQGESIHIFMAEDLDFYSALHDGA